MPGNEWAVPTQDPNCDVKQYKTARCEECTALNQKMEVRMAYGHAEAVILSNGKLNCVEVHIYITVGCFFYSCLQSSVPAAHHPHSLPLLVLFFSLLFYALILGKWWKMQNNHNSRQYWFIYQSCTYLKCIVGMLSSFCFLLAVPFSFGILFNNVWFEVCIIAI